MLDPYRKHPGAEAGAEQRADQAKDCSGLPDNATCSPLYLHAIDMSNRETLAVMTSSFALHRLTCRATNCFI